ncbi:CDC45-like protein [Hymenopellis radicata]|nr:CDC45-like protein [Hymenopellis radicata]
MVFIPPPQLATATRQSYGDAYNSILTAHRRSPLTSASSVVMLVAPDVDALCAARMLAALFKQDDVLYRIIPVSGISELHIVRDDLMTIPEVPAHINTIKYGGIQDLPSDEWFGWPSRKRRSIGDGNESGKRRRTNDERIPRMSRDERDEYARCLGKYYMAGTWHGQGAAATIYILATVLERVDNDLLWLAILGLTYQYTTARISRANIRATDELRFMLFRHWTLYDAMFHSSYVASKLGIWQDKGRKKLTGLLAKMGFSIPQTQQPYPHMDMDLKKVLVQKLNDIAPEYGMVELSYPSFMRCFGYRSQPLSAADAVEGIGALLDVASGVRMEIEVEGARNGGEWFGGGKLWEAPSAARESKRRRDDERENVPPGGEGAQAAKPKTFEEGDDEPDKSEVKWWVQNFWMAYDALVDIGPLRQALNLSMSLHRAIIRQGTSIIDKRDIRPMRSHHVVVLSQGPDLNLFAHPGVLSRLALWLVDALRDRMTGSNLGRKSKRKCLPFVVACLNESRGSYMVVGVTAALNFGDVRKNEFALQFLDAKERCNARIRHGSFDTSVLEIDQHDLKLFLDTLCEGPVDA